MKQKNRENENEEMSIKKKAKLEWRKEDCAHTNGRWIKFTGEGVKKKFHYETFEFHGKEYALEDSVALAPEKITQKSYIAIIKDIYRQGNEEDNIKLEVVWFYRREDIEQNCVGKLESKDLGDLFYSFHRDEVFAESVKHKCTVYFLPENKELPNPRASPDFIVRKFYHHIRKKLTNFTYRGFTMQQKEEINLLVAKTISRVGDLLPIDDKVKMTTTISRRKKSVSKRYIFKPDDERKIHERISTRVNIRNCDESVNKNSEVGEASRALSSDSNLKNFEIGGASETLSSDLNRGKSLEELMEAVKQHDDYDVVPMVKALENALYDSLVEDIPMYNFKVENLVDKLKNSQVFSRRLLSGELKPEQAIKMTRYELMRGFTFDELKAIYEDPTVEESVASTSTIVGPKDCFEGKK